MSRSFKYFFFYLYSLMIDVLIDVFVVVGSFFWRLLHVFLSVFSRDVVVGFSLLYIVCYAWVIKRYFWIAFEERQAYRRLLLLNTGMKSYYAVLSICLLLIVSLWFRASGLL